MNRRLPLFLVLAILFPSLFNFTAAGAIGLEEYEIDGNVVYIDNAYVRLAVWPHTSSGGWCYINFTSKQFGGMIDLVFGFDSDVHRVSKFQLYNPRIETSYYDEAIPKQYYNPANESEWAYIIRTNEGVYSGRQPKAREIFYSGTVTFLHRNPDPYKGWDVEREIEFTILDNRPGQWRVYWKVERSVLWDAPRRRAEFERRRFSYGGMDTWYILSFSVSRNHTYHARFWLDVVPSLDGGYGKYWVGVKRHSDTLLEAVQYRRFYALDPWWNGNWQYKMKLTVDHTKVDSNLTWFPVLVHLTSARINWTWVNDDLSDIRFVASDESTVLYAELEDYTVNDEAWIWVSRDGWVLDSDVDTCFYMYYGNPAASSAWNAEDVWDSYAKMVQHMVDNPDTSHITDSTSNNNDGTKKAANEPIETSNGKVNNAQNFDGVNDYVEVPAHSSLFPPTAISIEAWVKVTNPSSAAYEGFVCRNTRTNGLQLIKDWSNGKILFETPGVGSITSDYILTSNIWTHIVAILISNEKAYIYVNGKLDIEATGWALPTVSMNYWIGRAATWTTNPYLNGSIDEVRIYSRALTAAEVKANYYSGSDTLLTYGSESECVPLTIGGFQAPVIVYPTKATFFNITAHSALGLAYIKNVTLELEGDIELLWDEATKAFSEAADPNNYFTLGTCTYTAVNSTAYKISFHGALSTTYPEGYVTATAKVATDYATTSKTKTDWFLVSAPPIQTSFYAALLALFVAPLGAVIFVIRRKRR